MVKGALVGFWRKTMCSENEYPEVNKSERVEGDCLWGAGGNKTTTNKPSTRSKSTTTTTLTTHTTERLTESSTEGPNEPSADGKDFWGKSHSEWVSNLWFKQSFH